MKNRKMLTPKQNELFNIALEKGFVTLGDGRKFYSTPDFSKNAFKRLCELGFLEETNVTGVFKVKGELDDNANTNN